MAETGIRYSRDHLWIEHQNRAIARIGVTFHYLDQLATIKIVELPEAGSRLARGEVMATLESSKAAVDLPAPVSGEVVAVNQAVVDDPGLINREPTSAGWLVKIKMAEPGELNNLLTAEDYQALVMEQGI